MNFERKGRIRFQPRSCPLCGKMHEPVDLDAEKFYRWKEKRELIQDVFPEIPKEQREILISGTCPDCFKKLSSLAEEEDLELESDDDKTVITEEMQRDKQDKMNAAIEIECVREDYKHDQKDLLQMSKDLESLEKQEEEKRQKDLEEWYESVEEQNRFFCTDPFYPSGF